MEAGSSGLLVSLRRPNAEHPSFSTSLATPGGGRTWSYRLPLAGIDSRVSALARAAVPTRSPRRQPGVPRLRPGDLRRRSVPAPGACRLAGRPPRPAPHAHAGDRRLAAIDLPDAAGARPHVVPGLLRTVRRG